MVSACLPTMRPLVRRLFGQKDSRTTSRGRTHTPAFTKRTPFQPRTGSLDQTRSNTAQLSSVQVPLKSVDSGETYHDLLQSSVTSTSRGSSTRWSDPERGLMPAE